jgi:MFS family permease
MSVTPPQPEQRSRLRGAARRIALDLTPLRVSRDFRRLWIGLFLSETGYQFALVAVYVQVYVLTRSPAAVGVVGLFSFVALLAGSIASGAILDAYDRRSLLLIAQIGFAVGSGILLIGAVAGDPPLWTIYLAVAIHAAVSSIDSPTRSAMTPRLVGRELVPSAAALNQVVWNGVGLIGPALAGLVIARLGLKWAYAVDLVTYGAMFTAAWLVAPMRPERGEGATTGWAAVKEGFAFVKRRRLLQSTFVIDIIAMVFGMPRALFPILALTQFHRGIEVVGFLMAAPAFGALLGALTGGWARHVDRQGRAVAWAVAGWGLAIAAFGAVGGHLWLALVFLALAGAADVVSAIFRSTILQLAVPDALRGRLSGIHILVVTGGPRLGDLEAGLVAQAFSPFVSVVSGGLLCVAGAALVALGYPELRRYRARSET